MPLDMADVEAAADIAIATGDVVILDIGVAVVPDIAVMFFAANGAVGPSTWILQRDDGRSCSLYRVPVGAVPS